MERRRKKRSWLSWRGGQSRDRPASTQKAAKLQKNSAAQSVKERMLRKEEEKQNFCPSE